MKTHTKSRNNAPALFCLVLTFLSTALSAFAASATWDASPATNDWNTNGNWTPATGYPNGAGDVATFDTSNTTGISISGNNIGQTQVAQMVFDSGASAFTFTLNTGVDFTISGTGITNSSANAQSFVTNSTGNSISEIQFTNSATAGSNTFFTNNAGTNSGDYGSTQFSGNASAGSATFTNNGAGTSGPTAQTDFFNSSTAGSATFNNNSGTSFGGNGGSTQFFQTSNAGNGVFNNSGGAVDGAIGGKTIFGDSASAGSATFTVNGGAASSASAGSITFNNSSTAASATFTVNPATNSLAASSGTVSFNGTSTAGSAIITNNGGGNAGVAGGATFFNGSASAGSATITNYGATVSGAGGAATQFAGTSTAGSAILIANAGTGSGGIIEFFQNSTGGTAQVQVFGSAGQTAGNLDISFHNAPGVTVGSIEGSGNVFLGTNNLTVGGNNLNKTFSGVIQDGGLNGGAGGSLTKTGTGSLSLTNANTFSGGTLINVGTLIAAHDGALGTGNVSLTASGVNLTLQSGVLNNYIADNATLSIASGATTNLNFTGADLVSGLILGGVAQAPGIYNAVDDPSFFTGLGDIIVVPEPSTCAMLTLGTLALLGLRRFFRAAADIKAIPDAKQ